MEYESQNNNKFPLKENQDITNHLLNNKNIKSKNKSNLNINNLNIIYYFIFFSILFSLLFLIISRKNNHNNIPTFNLKKYFSNQKQKHIDSDYERVSPNDEKYIYIPIISTSDFHGRFFPENNEIVINSQKILYKTGGLEYTAKYINILREEFGKNRVLYFDIGDQFFQTNETILFNGNNIIEFLNKIGLNGTTLGNHEFIYRRDWIENKIKKAKYPYIINNIQDKKTNQKNGILGKNQETSHLYEIKLDNGDIIKIGVIGITLQNNVDKEFYTVGNRHTWNDIIFQSYETDLEN